MINQMSMVRDISLKNVSKFNPDIKNIRKQDDIASFINEVGVELEKILPENVKYLGYTYDDSIEKTNELSSANSGVKNVKKNVIPIHVKDTYAKLASFMFEYKLVTDKKDNNGNPIVEHSRVKMPIWIPLLVDDYHYKIRGNKYSAPLQIIDKITYANQSDVLILKTMTRPIKICRTKCVSIEDVFGKKYITQQFHIHVSRKKIPFLLFYFARFGFEGTLDFFSAKGYIKLVNIKNIYNITEEQKEKYLYFKYGQHYLQVERWGFENCLQVRQFIACMLNIVKKNMDIEFFSRNERWLALLGSHISDTNAIEKGAGLVNTFINALDFRTITLISQLVPDGDKKSNMFAVVRWLFKDFANLSSKKTTDITNKRIRLGEYIISPIIKNVQAKIYRFMNTNKKSRNIKRLEDITKVTSQILLYSLVGKIKKKDLRLDIVKYSATVNDNALLNVGLRCTFGGPGSPGQNSGKHISVSHRQFDETCLNNICITFTSNSDPGIIAMVVPMAKIDMNNKVFI